MTPHPRRCGQFFPRIAWGGASPSAMRGSGVPPRAGTARIALLGARVTSLRRLRGGLVRLEAVANGVTMPCFGFDIDAENVRSGSEVDILGSMRRDTFRGTSSVEMRLLDLQRRR